MSSMNEREEQAPSDASRPATPGEKPRLGRGSRWVLCSALAIVVIGMRFAAVHSESINWDEFNLVHHAAWTHQSGELHAGGRPGLAVLVLLPLVADCEDEIDVVRRGRILWIAFTLAAIAGLAALILQLNPNSPRRYGDAVLGVLLLALVPDFLLWSVQIRADQIAIAAALWGSVALLASRSRPGLATVAGLLFGIGTLSSQKALYLVALAGLLALFDCWRMRERGFVRDGLRGLLCLSAMGLAIVGYYALIPRFFESAAIPANLALPVEPFASEGSGSAYRFQMGVFDYYRSTIGFSQYVEMLPSLIPQIFFALGMLLAAARQLARGKLPGERDILAWSVMALGVGVCLFHAGAFKYFWMTLGVFPVVAFVLARQSVEALLEPLPAAVRTGIRLVFLCGLIAPGAMQMTFMLRDTQAVQRESFAFTHANFEATDAGFQAEAGLFCREEPNRFPAYFSQKINREFGPESRCADCAIDLIHRFYDEQVRFVVASFRMTQFPPAVQNFWQDHYLPYRGSVLVAGKFFRDEGAAGKFDLVADGEYLWLPNSPPSNIEIDGVRVMTGGRMRLEQGQHEVQFPEGNAAGMLVLAMDGPPKLPLTPFYRSY